MEEPLTPDFSAFEKPDMNYYKKRTEQAEDQNSLSHLQNSIGVTSENKLAQDDVTHLADDASLKEEVSLQVVDDVNSGSDYDTDIELPSKNAQSYCGNNHHHSLCLADSASPDPVRPLGEARVPAHLPEVADRSDHERQARVGERRVGAASSRTDRQRRVGRVQRARRKRVSASSHPGRKPPERQVVPLPRPGTEGKLERRETGQCKHSIEPCTHWHLHNAR